MSMPRPRILGSPWPKRKESEDRKDPQIPTAPVKRHDEPDCEIIKIEDDEGDNEDEKEPKFSTDSFTIEVSQAQSSQRLDAIQFVKQCPMKLQDYNNGPSMQGIVAPISPALSLRFVPDTSLGVTTQARNLYSDQSVVMVLPVNTVSSRVFNSPTLCTLATIKNPNESSGIKRNGSNLRLNRPTSCEPPPLCPIDPRRDSKTRFDEMKKKVLQKIYKDNTNDATADSSARCSIPWKRRVSNDDRPHSGNRPSTMPTTSSPISNSAPEIRGIDISSVDIEECFVSVANSPTSTYRFVDLTGIVDLSVHRTETVARPIASSSPAETLQVHDCSIPVIDEPTDCSHVNETNPICPSREIATDASSVDELSAACNRVGDSSEKMCLSAMNRRPVPPLTRITDETESSGEQTRLVSMAREQTENFHSSCEIVVSSMNEERSIPAPRETSEIVDSSVNEERSIPMPQLTPEIVDSAVNEESSISVQERLPEIVDSSKATIRSNPRQKELQINLIPLEATRDSACLLRSKETTEKNASADRQRSLTSLRIGDESSSRPDDNDTCVISDQVIEILVDEDEPPTRISETSSCETIDVRLWKAQCISCKGRFPDRTELHRHATLAHPGIRILFCDHCSESFLTDGELMEHRWKDCEREISTNVPTVDTPAINVASQFLRLWDKKISSRGRKPWKEGRETMEPVPGNSRTLEDKPRSRLSHKKVVVADDETKNLWENSVACPNTGVTVEKRKPQTKNKTVVLKYSYVEEEVIRHSGASEKSKFKSAEIKKLSVSLRRLEASVLKKYLAKLAESPVTIFRAERRKRRYIRRNRENNENINFDSLRRGKRKKCPPMRYEKCRRGRRVAMRTRNSITSDSDTDDGIGNNGFPSKFHGPGVVKEYLPKIDCRKDPETDTDSSAVVYVSKSFLDSEDENTLTRKWRKKFKSLDDESLEVGRDMYDVEANVSVKKKRTVIRKQSRASIANYAALRFERRRKKVRDRRNDTTKNRRNGRSSRDCKKCIAQSDMSDVEAGEDDGDATSNGKKPLKITLTSKNSPRKMYLPSRRYSKVATKLQKQGDEARTNVSKTNESCTMCKELSIMMKQVARQIEANHVKSDCVQCPFCDHHFISTAYLEKHVAGNHLQCENVMPCRLSRNTARPDATLEPECPQRMDEFGNESELHDHDTLTLRGDISATDAPDNPKNLSSLCTKTVDRVETVSSPRESPPWRHHSDEPNFTSPTTIRRILDSCCAKPPDEERKNSHEGVDEINALSDIDDSFKDKVSTFECWVCDKKFGKRSDYVRHMREIHELSKAGSSSSLRDNWSDSFDTARGNSTGTVKIDATTKLGPSDRFTADRDSLLKQLLSDDSMDGVEPIRPSDNGDTARSVTVEENIDGAVGKKIIGRLSGHTCGVCSKEFHRAQDLLVHSIVHVNETETVGERISASRDHSGAVENASEGTNSGHKRKLADSSVKSAKRSTNGNFANPKNSRKKVDATPRVSKRSALEEILDTEKDLANVNATRVDEKLPIECAKCNRKFPNQASLNEHLFFLHDDSLKDTVLTGVVKSEDTKERRWRCGSCMQEFKQSQGYRRHRYMMHGDETMVHVCDNCNKILTNVTMVNVHICTDVASYQCRDCDLTFTTGMSLRLHNSEKHLENDEPNVCSMCDKKFLTRFMLNRHVKWRHRSARRDEARERSIAVNKEESLNGIYGGFTDTNFQFGADERRDGKYREKNRRRRSHDDETSVGARGKTSVAELAHGTIKYIDENEIYQCSLCQLYCLNETALESHRATIHSRATQACQLCRKNYPEGKLTRHMIDQHINPCESYRPRHVSIFDSRMDDNERDAEEFVRILGLTRLILLWEYQRYREATEDCRFHCPTCGEIFPTNALYVFHVFMQHDTICILCNIEFKSSRDAAAHKGEEHRSASCYMWFVDGTLKEITSATNIYDVVERSFIEMISRDGSESPESNDFSALDDESPEMDKANSSEEATTTEATDATDARTEMKENNNEKLIVVVTDEDLEKYKIGTPYPNIWGLASKISSTCEDLTPTEVKQILESYFEQR